MYHRWAALALVLALCAVPTKQAAGQQSGTTQPRGRKVGSLGQNFPNPFNPETRIPFAVDCDGSAGQHVVSLRIYNVLAQLVSVPLLEGEVGTGRPLATLTIPCGQYVAYWDGKVLGSGREAASGVYLYELVVDGQRLSRKMFVAK
jgi:hypothetical protein